MVPNTCGKRSGQNWQILAEVSISLRDSTLEAACQSNARRDEQPYCHRLGLLAVVYGDGEVEVLAIPHPDSLQNVSGASSSRDPQGSAGTAYLRLRCKAAATTKAIDCHGSCVDWLPSAPHDLLVVRPCPAAPSMMTARLCQVPKEPFSACRSALGRALQWCTAFVNFARELEQASRQQRDHSSSC